VTAIVTQGDARSLPFPDDSIDLIVTSPPYFGLRSYTDGGAHYATQIGSEATPQEFIAALVECTREMMRVLKPSGSIFVNLGDKYGPDKSLRLLPERYRIACTDELGLIARAVIVWSKPNGLPESVRDRVRRSHEDWVHLTLGPKYFEAVDEIREPHTAKPQRRFAPQMRDRGEQPDGARPRRPSTLTDEPRAGTNPLGKLPGSVWSIPTQPLRVPAELNVDHFAAFPMEWPRRLITGWCPREVCTACGEGRRPVTEKSEPYIATQNRSGGLARPEPHGGSRSNTSLGFSRDVVLTGYACACLDTSAPSTPGVVLDPFGGTGTTALVADVLGRVGISLDASADYGRIAQWRTQDPKQRERAGRGVTQPVRPTTDTMTKVQLTELARVVDGELDLSDLPPVEDE
jgi:DNA modification methylase